MNRFVATLTAAMTLSHVLVGCCAQAVQGATYCDAAAVVRDSHHDHEASHEDESSPSPCHGDQCCRVKCQWTAPDVVGPPDQDQLWCPLTIVGDQISGQGSATASLNCDAPTTILFTLPVRSHLALGVLLI